jgi:tryptophan synthase beta chain
MGQGLLVKRMGKSRVIAETGAGQHGVATATMAAKYGLECTIYMGEKDVVRQRPNVFWMERLGARVIPVTDGSRILKDAINEAFRDWVSNMDNTHYVLGTACGPHPYPEMVSYFQSIIGKEARGADTETGGETSRPGLRLRGRGIQRPGNFQWVHGRSGGTGGNGSRRKGLHTGKHASRWRHEDGSPGVAQGYKTYFLQNEDGQMNETHSVAAGLDYIGVSPILASLGDSGRVRFERRPTGK